MLKFVPSCKKCYCLNLLPATGFSASFVHAAFEVTTSFAERVAEHQNVFSTFSFRIHVLPLHSNLNRNWPKKHFAFWKLFCKHCFAFKSCKNTILLEMLLPAANWDKEIPYKRGKNSTTWCRFRSCKFKHPFQGLLLSQLFAGKSICSNIVCMQICNAQQLLHKEMRKATFLLKFFHFQLLCLHFTFLLAIACCAAALR